MGTLLNDWDRTPVNKRRMSSNPLTKPNYREYYEAILKQMSYHQDRLSSYLENMFYMNFWAHTAKGSIAVRVSNRYLVRADWLDSDYGDKMWSIYVALDDTSVFKYCEKFEETPSLLPDRDNFLQVAYGLSTDEVRDFFIIIHDKDTCDLRSEIFEWIKRPTVYSRGKFPEIQTYDFWIDAILTLITRPDEDTGSVTEAE